MGWLLASSLIVLAVATAGVAGALRMRNMQYWLPSYWSTRRRRARPWLDGTTVYVCLADHFEPYGGGVSRQQGEDRVSRWVTTYPLIAKRHSDSVGRSPQHTFFYPLEDYDPAALDQLAGIARRGFGDVEVHYHHDNDTANGLARELSRFALTLHERHGVLRIEPGSTEPVYAFIHGNWALDNSRPDGRWCGVDNELDVLVATGCRVDFTMPSAPSDTQTRKINSIYFARGKHGQRKSHDWGRDVVVGEWAKPGELLLVQGPLGLNWRSRKLGLIPRIENGEVSADAPATVDRVRLWARLGPRVQGAEQHVFIKLHTHGATDESSSALLEGGLDRLWSALEKEFRDRPGSRLRYVTAWEMYTSIRDVAQGCVPK